ncbi:MAG: TIGR02996 domain-containing protein [Archangiaceae bacterium]|nr:TIGR02996 domain-containing protein [Archangiaceae bacterium]
MTGPAITSSPFALRQWSIEHEVRPHLAKVFEKKPEIQSVLMCVGQYWADEADDAVHSHLVFSSRPTPRWPHECEDTYLETRGDGDLCSSCAWGSDEELEFTWLSWDSNGSAIRAWQALCIEGASQEESPNDSYTPVLLARRTEDGFSLDVVGPVMRPWLDLPQTAYPEWFERQGTKATEVHLEARDAAELPFREAIAQAPFDDGPRLVFADWLQQRQDPLGEFISLSLSKQRTDEVERRRQELLARHTEAWLGPLVRVVAPGSADFSRGLLTSASVHFDASTRELANDSLFSTVETLRFGATSEVVFSPTMTALKSVAGVRSFESLPASVEEVACSLEAVRRGVPARVRRLTIVCGADQDEGQAIEAARSVRTVERLSIARGSFETNAQVELRDGMGLDLGGWSPAQMPTGWWLHVPREGAATLELRGLSSSSSSTSFRDHLLAQVLERGGVSALRLRPNDLWKPSRADVEGLEARTKLPVEVEAAAPIDDVPPLPPPKREAPAPMPVRVDPVTRSVHLEVVDSAPITAASRLPRFPLFVLIVGVLGLIARACAAGP